MKKTAVIICSLVLACILAAATVMTFATPAEKSSIGSQKALEIALKDAGVSAESAKEVKSVFSKKNLKQIFDVEFEYGQNDYDYIIDAKTGEIISRDIDNDTDDKNERTTSSVTSTTATTVPSTTAPATTTVQATTKAPETTVSSTKSTTAAPVTAQAKTEPNTESKNTTEAKTEIRTTAAPTTTKKQTSAFITAAKAKEIALADSGVKKSKAFFTKAKLEKDDGIYEYDIKFYVGLTEYEYSINAKTGSILEKDIDRPIGSENQTTRPQKTTAAQTTKKPAEQTSSFISINKAKQIALSHAGLNENDVSFKKVKLDKDEGIYEYEVEFYSGRFEYEYSINAKTGKIIDFEKDIDD